MNVIFSSLDKNKTAGGWQETAVYVEEALQEQNIPFSVSRPPKPENITACDILYEGSYVTKLSRNNLTILKQRFPKAVHIMQMINAHPKTYLAIYNKELTKYDLRDDRFGTAWEVEFSSVLADTDYIFCHSNWIQKSLIANGKSIDQIRVIPKGVDTNFWQVGNRLHKSFRIGFAGQLQIIKGIQYLFEAWTQLKSPGELWICGPKVEYVVDGKRVWSCGKIFESYLSSSYKGWFRKRTELLNFYSNLDVFIAPSLEDGWNMTAVEAMSCSLPVITTSTTGMAQIIEDGVNGFIIPPKDVDAIKEKVSWCVQNRDQLKFMGINARNTVLRYDIATYKHNLVEAFRSCIDP